MKTVSSTFHQVIKYTTRIIYPSLFELQSLLFIEEQINFEQSFYEEQKILYTNVAKYQSYTMKQKSQLDGSIGGQSRQP